MQPEDYTKSLAFTSLYFVTNGWFITSTSGRRSSGFSFNNCSFTINQWKITMRNASKAYSDDHISGFGREVRGKSQVHVTNPLVRILLRFSLSSAVVSILKRRWSKEALPRKVGLHARTHRSEHLMPKGRRNARAEHRESSQVEGNPGYHSRSSALHSADLD